MRQQKTDWVCGTGVSSCPHLLGVLWSTCWLPKGKDRGWLEVPKKHGINRTIRQLMK